MTKLMQGPIFFHIKRRLFLECNRWTYLQTRLWWTLFTSFRYQDSQSSLCTVVVLVREEHLLLSESCLHVWVSVCLWRGPSGSQQCQWVWGTIPAIDAAKRTEQKWSVLCWPQTKKEEIWSSLFICSQREHVWFLCITVWKDYRHRQISLLYQHELFYASSKVCIK